MFHAEAPGGRGISDEVSKISHSNVHAFVEVNESFDADDLEYSLHLLCSLGSVEMSDLA